MRIFYTISLLLLFTLSGYSQDQPVNSGNHPNVHKIVLKEVLQTTSYTYLLAAETDKVQWLAVPKMEAEVGETYYYQGGMQMGEFKSTELDRVFESILFLSGVVSPEIVEGGTPSETPSPVKKVDITEEENLSVEPAKGGITIGELLSNKEKYSGQVVKIRGKVTKFNEGIMGKNWIHLQDGTGHDGKFDLTATSDAVVIVRDIITIEGIVVLDKDFGSGYFYDIIIEGARVAE